MGTQQRVLHRDIKSSNILLDENWNARISDLGLSKYGPANQQYTFLVSNAVGTIGYCDPQYVETGLLTKESDVYSFGVVLFEVFCGRLCIGNDNDKRVPLTGLVRQFYKQNKIDEIVYSNIKDEINPDSLKAFTAIAYQCLNRDREARPLMTEAVKILENALNYQTTQSHVERKDLSVPILQQTEKGSEVDSEAWVACDRCLKWRLLPIGIDPSNLPEKWQCSMSIWLPPGKNHYDIIEDETTRAVQELNLHILYQNQNSL